MKTIIVDDELNARSNLKLLLKNYCPNVKIIAEAETAEEAFLQIELHSPQLLFLDIQLPKMNGIELAELVSQKRNDVKIIFVTAHDQYILQALRASASDYLLKPVNIDQLQEAVDRVNKNSAPGMGTENLKVLAQNVQRTNELVKLILPWEGGMKIFDVRDIFYITSDNSYSEVFLESKRLTVSKSIGDIESILSDSGFFRIHNRHIINLNYMDTYSSNYGGSITLKNGKILPISRRKVSSFKEYISMYFGS